MDEKQLHTCSYYCMHPACVIAQRDFLRDKVEQLQQDIRQLLSEERTNDTTTASVWFSRSSAAAEDG